jgi:DNA recombination protein RmuC
LASPPKAKPPPEEKLSYPSPSVRAMESLIVALLGLIAGSAAALALMRRGPPGTDGAQSVQEIARLRDELRRIGDRATHDVSVLVQRLEGIDHRMTRTQDTSARLAQGIFETLGDVRRATSTVAEQAREFSALQDMLKAPQSRGGLGEALLEDLLRQVLPPQAFALQHRFASGRVVDAVVRLGDRIVCIDSKFPLANFRRMCEASIDADRSAAERDFAADVDRHIRDISCRYVVPDEGTFEFAFMYVPAEGIYGEVLRLSHRKKPLFEAAIEARVVPMSPLTMYPYLQTVLFGLKCLSIEKSAESILGACGRMQQDLERFASDYDTLGRHLTNARAKHDDGARRLSDLRHHVDRAISIGDESQGRPSLEAVAE